MLTRWAKHELIIKLIAQIETNLRVFMCRSIHIQHFEHPSIALNMHKSTGGALPLTYKYSARE
jgi:hypothetical protein